MLTRVINAIVLFKLLAMSHIVLSAERTPRLIKISFEVKEIEGSRKVVIQGIDEGTKGVRSFKKLIQRCLELEAKGEKVVSGFVEVTVKQDRIAGINSISQMPKNIEGCIRTGIAKDPQKPLKISTNLRAIEI